MSEQFSHFRTAFIIVILRLIAPIILAKGYDGGCQLCFTVQPAEILYCNPYTNISLECQIEGPFSPTPQILWFSNPQPPLGDTVEIKGSKPGYNIVNTTQFVEMTRTTQSVLTIQNLTAGEYWCQIYVEGMEPEISQKLCITELGDYGRYDECNRANISLETSKCWDIPTTCVTEVPTIMATSSYNSASLNSASPINSVRVLNNGTHATQLVQGLSSLIAATPLTTNGETTPRSSPGRTDELEGLVETPKGFEMWLYIVASLAGLFALLILVLTIICIGLCVLYPRTHPKPLHLHSNKLVTFQSNPGSPIDIRPSTSVTEQTEVVLSAISHAAKFDSLERDYDEIDDKGEDSPPLSPVRQRYLESLAEEVPTMFTPTSQLAFYSEISPNNSSSQALLSHSPGAVQLNGYGRLDHTRSRQTYHPRRDSPLLSGYRKLEHVTVGFRAQTLPQGVLLQPGYANVGVPSTAAHVRSNSLPNSQYSNLQHVQDDRSLSVGPTSDVSREKYANFQIIEEENERKMSNNPAHYHMLEDIPVDSDGEKLQEYEFLPTCEDSEEAMTAYNNLPQDLSLKLQDHNPPHRVVHSLAKEALEEKLSLDSQSTDFTGPFFFPHMTEFGEPLSPDSDRHTYRALDLSTMEPEVGYASVSIITDSEDY